ncbi:MAG: cytochrome c oxidase subunit II [Candidatus Zixiibacteriota bacterium]
MDTVSFPWLPSAASTTAADVDALFNFILFAGLAFFLIVTAGVIAFVLRHRRRGKAGLTYGKDHSLALEITWTVIPVILIVIVFVWGFKGYMRMNVVPHGALEIKVTAQKWFWTFDHPDGANAVNELVVPVGKPVKLLMSSADVIHSFFVPNFRVKMDVLPNRYTVTWFEATAEGVYPLYCAEYCGKGHSEMLAAVRVVSDSSYQAWLNANSVMGAGLTLEQYGAQLYTTKACVTCHSLDGTAKDGPSFKGRFGTEILLSDGSRLLMDENYMRESILDPRAKMANGFQPVMPTFQGILKDRQIDALIAYIKSLNQK